VITQAQQQTLQQFIRARQVAWSQFIPGCQWNTESLANEIATDARLAKVRLCGFCHGPTDIEIRNIRSPFLAFAGSGADLTVVSAAEVLARHKRWV
jgi:cytochrome c553